MNAHFLLIIDQSQNFLLFLSLKCGILVFFWVTIVLGEPHLAKNTRSGILSEK